MGLNKKQIVALREKGFTYQAIGDKFGVSRQRIEQIVSNQKRRKGTSGIVERFHKTRASLDISIFTIARETGLSPSTVANFGLRTPHISTTTVIEKWLNEKSVVRPKDKIWEGEEKEYFFDTTDARYSAHHCADRQVRSDLKEACNEIDLLRSQIGLLQEQLELLHKVADNAELHLDSRPCVAKSARTALKRFRKWEREQKVNDAST